MKYGFEYECGCEREYEYDGLWTMEYEYGIHPSLGKWALWVFVMIIILLFIVFH